MTHHRAESHPEARVLPFQRGPQAPVTSVQGSLALDLTPRLDPPAPTPRPLRAADLTSVDEPSRARLDAFVRRYLQAVVEISVGDRPVTQVLRHTVPDVYADLGRRALLVSQAAGRSPDRGRGPGISRPVVVGARTSLVRADALEACAHVRYGHRSRAVAARFEQVRDRWQCVALEFA